MHDSHCVDLGISKAVRRQEVRENESVVLNDQVLRTGCRQVAEVDDALGKVCDGGVVVGHEVDQIFVVLMDPDLDIHGVYNRSRLWHVLSNNVGFTISRGREGIKNTVLQ